MVRRILIVVLLAIGVGGMWWAFSSDSRQEDATPGEQSQQGGAVAERAVERLVPARGDLILRQDAVGVDLAPGYDAELIIEGRQIPLDQLDKNEALNEVFYRPGPDKEVEALDAGDLCVTALVRDLTRAGAPAEPVEWCFRVA